MSDHSSVSSQSRSLTSCSIWTIGKDLRAYDHLRDYLSGSKKFKIDDVLSDDEEEDVTEKKWQRAFRVDALMGKDHNYWTNAIKQERAQRKIRDLMRVQKRRRSNSGRQNPRAPKRRGDDEYARSKRIHRLEADVDEGRADDRIATYRNDQNAEQEAIQADYRQTIENQPG